MRPPGRKRGEKLSDHGEDDETSEDTLPTKPFKHARPGPTFDGDDSDSSSETEDVPDADDTFIVEDDSAPLELPTEFSMSTYQDLTHHFKVICQLFVHLAVQEKEDRAEFMAQMMKGKLEGSHTQRYGCNDDGIYRAIFLRTPTNRSSKDRRHKGLNRGLLRLAYRI